MTRQADIKKLLMPLIAQHEDLAYWRRCAIIKPIHHFIRFVLLDNTAGLTGFRPRWGVCDNFDVQGIQHLTYTTEFNRAPHGLWETTIPNVADELAGRIENEILPRLRPLRSHADVMGFIVDPSMQFHDSSYAGHAQTLLVIAGGDLEAGREPLERLAGYGRIWRGTDMEPVVGPIVDDLKPLVDANDRKGIGALLLKWEERWIRKNKLEKFWEPTPFPVEMT